LAGWYSTNILGNRDGEVLDDPRASKRRRVQARRPRTHPPAGPLPELYGDIYHKCRINYYPPRGDNKEGWDNIDIFGWMGTRCRSRSTSSAETRSSRRPSCWTLPSFFDLAHRAGMKGIQEWLSFYFKSPQHAPRALPGTRPLHPADEVEEHPPLPDGEEQITHLGIEYYEE
jgi:myo-inositol-1-phosphate synthase